MKESNVPKKHVKVHASRGYGDNVFIVRGRRNSGSQTEVQLSDLSASTPFWIYEAHTYKDMECHKADLAELKRVRIINQSIGLKHAHQR